MAKPLLPFSLFSLQGLWFFATLSIPIASIATLFVKRPGYDAAFISAIISYALVLIACIPGWRASVQTRSEFWMRLFIDDNTQYLVCSLILLTAPRPVVSSLGFISLYAVVQICGVLMNSSITEKNEKVKNWCTKVISSSRSILYTGVLMEFWTLIILIIYAFSKIRTSRDFVALFGFYIFFKQRYVVSAATQDFMNGISAKIRSFLGSYVPFLLKPYGWIVKILGNGVTLQQLQQQQQQQQRSHQE